MRSVLRGSLIFCLFSALLAFGQLKGRIEQSDGPPITEIYKSQDPTKGRPQVMQAASGPNGRECIPPKRGNWILVTRIGDTCYWYEPHVVFNPGYVVSVGDIKRVPGKCGRHPWDNRLAICEAPAGASVNDPYADDKPGPCEISGSLSGPEYRAILYSAEYRKRCVFAGGYDPENNPGRAGTATQDRERRGAARPPQQQPLAASVEYARGLAEGVGECVKGFGDLFAGAQYAMRGDFVNAATMWGVRPGDSMTIRAILTEAQAPSVGAGVTPKDAGKNAGRRLCAFAIVPGMAKGVGGYVKKISVEGRTPLRPVPGAAVLEGLADDARAPSLAGKWISTTGGPVKLGKFVGRGSFGTAFEGADPAKIVKVGNNNTKSVESFVRQKLAATQLEKAGIPTPRIHQHIREGPLHPPVLTMENAFKRWPGAFAVPDGAISKLPHSQQTPVLHAIEDFGNEMADAGLVLADNHPGNFVFVPKPGGGLRAIIVDADFIAHFEELTNAPGLNSNPVVSMASTVLFKANMNYEAIFRPTTARGWTDALYKARYGIPISRGGGTNPLP